MSLVDYLSSSDDSGGEGTAVSKSTSIAPKVATKRRDPVKITLPSFEEFEDEETKPTCKKPQQKKSGLLSMLPAPKYAIASTTSLVPQAVSKKKPVAKTSNSSVLKKALETPKAVDEVDQVGSSSNFFSLEDKKKSPQQFHYSDLSFSTVVNSSSGHSTNSTNEILQDSAYKSSLSSSDYVQNSSTGPSLLTFDEGVVTTNDNAYISPQQPVYYEEHAIASSSSGSIINDEGFSRLRNKRKRGLEEIKLIDICGDSLVSSANEWHTKSITEEKKLVHSRKKGAMPTQTQKRKHQITYLAFQGNLLQLTNKQTFWFVAPGRKLSSDTEEQRAHVAACLRALDMLEWLAFSTRFDQPNLMKAKIICIRRNS